MKLENYLTYLQQWIYNEVKKANQKGVIVAISGGIDSAVVAALAQKSFPNNYLTVWMPCQSSELDEKCKNELIESLQLKCQTIDLNDLYNQLIHTYNQENVNISEIALANSKARLRMTCLYGLAQTNNYLVLGTDNADEWHIGYFTKYGDGSADLNPIIHLLKKEVKKAGKILNIPDSIIDRDPTASLWEGQTDEKEIGFGYDLIDMYLLGEKVQNQVKQKIEHMHEISSHKRSLAKIPNRFERKKGE